MGELLGLFVWIGILLGVSAVAAFIGGKLGLTSNWPIATIFVFKTLVIGLLVASLSSLLGIQFRNAIAAIKREIGWSQGFIRVDLMIAATLGSCAAFIAGRVILRFERILGRMGRVKYNPEIAESSVPLTIAKGLAGWAIGLLVVSLLELINASAGESWSDWEDKLVFAAGMGAFLTYCVSRVLVWTESGANTITG